MRHLVNLVLLSCFAFSYSFANDGYRIEIEIDNYEPDTLVVGYYFGKQTLVLDTLLKNTDGGFLLQDTASLDAGVYLLLLKPDNQFVQFLVDEKEQEFTISFDAEDLTEVDIEGSFDNKLFNDYMIFLRGKRKLREPLVSQRDTEGISEFELESY